MRIPEPIVHAVAHRVPDFYRGVFVARRTQARAIRRLAGTAGTGPAETSPMQRRDPSRRRRNILLITADQQRFDALGCHGQQIARTPNLDALATSGVDFDRAHVQNAVCMPSRSTLLTGQHPRTHGVVANGVPLPKDALSVAGLLRESGYRTALIGKPHFQPHLDLFQRFDENRLASSGQRGSWYGFDHVESAGHGPTVPTHYTDWLYRHHRDAVGGFATVLTGEGGGDTGAPELHHNPIPADQYHTSWCAERAVEHLAGLGDDSWFCWLSFPDPHHPFDPPFDEVRKRIDWRDVPLPSNHLRGAEAENVLGSKPTHWEAWWRGEFTNPEGGPTSVVPSRVTEDQIRETTAMIAVENELIDEAVGRVLAELDRTGALEHTDVIYTSDHGDLGGDYGLLFKGPYHVDALMRVPLIWRPAPTAEITPNVVREPVGLVDVAPTICEIAGIEVPPEMDGAPLPTAAGSGRERVLTTWDSQFAAVGMHLRTIHRDGLTCTRYEPSTTDVGGRFRVLWGIWARNCSVPRYDGTEGELYDHTEDPQQRINLWDDPRYRTQRDDLLSDLADHLPPARTPALRVAAPT